MKAIVSGAAICLGLMAAVPADAADAAPAWSGYAGNAQHTARAPAQGDMLKAHIWQMKIDLHPQIVNDDLLIHYASPMITESNTVLVPVKTGTTDGFSMEARLGATGTKLWEEASDYVLPPHDWTPPFPAHLTKQNRLYYAGAGGTVLFRDKPDSKTGATGRVSFYSVSFKTHSLGLTKSVMISTPINSDNAGNIYFGFVATAANPAHVVSGIARIDANGKGTWVSATSAASDSSITEVAQNCAPAISADQSTIYIAVSTGSAGYLLGLNSKTLKTKYKIRLMDPLSGEDAQIADDSSASPTVGPDGDVYYGVLETTIPQHNDRGWLLHFNSTLSKTKTPGSFGWDDTVSVVPSSSVASYTGKSSYLVMSKYNNYLGVGTGDGHNEIAILDPHASQTDLYSSATVMNEVLTKVGPTQYPGAPAGAVYEWCINSAVVDAKGHAVYANSEDGHTYRWNLNSNKFTQIELNGARGEAYTPTLIGPDGTVYAINDSKLYALGVNSKVH